MDLNATDKNNRDIAMGIFSILHVVSNPLPTSQIRVQLNLTREAFDEALVVLKDILQHYTPFFIQEIERSICLRTRPEYSEYVKIFVDTKRQRSRLTDEALLTLAIIAYEQPVRKSKIDEMRGVDSEKTLDTLKKYGLIEITGRLEIPGAPILYITTSRFLEQFGLKSLSDLPSPSTAGAGKPPLKTSFF